ncbi:hypothetical protein [Natrinema gari]|uniref:hypothetical protein n=1 Tax=Natrinema gari TaxID=419186 RepID=UPI0012697D66|nr:hypothetical protein [Natrinema gari]
MAENDGQKRRRVLQNLGIGSVTTLSSIPVVGAARNDQTQDLVGMSYDTLTHETGELVTGQIPARNDSGGSIEVAGFNIPLGKLEEKSTKADRVRSSYAGVLHDEEFNSKNSRSDRKAPLKVRIDQKTDHVSGMLSRPSGEFGRLGFLPYRPR